MATTSAHPSPVLDDSDGERPSRLGTVLPVVLSVGILAGVAALGLGAGGMLVDAALRFLGGR
ncbi:hypothetical protein Bcav_3245 [Beutenbergia cavernae DSM 12333]|uniref:Uncharacterized protein n=1 Tax=Beutenbergia cavernae (strain ATCC BAA-8 / DSM 12333 / CCUG 43141 / JCM 11478 / NBRC 16432 / NCIMB 13614 / HKI 0122) TaxID=471853 RepID=C5C179_BEUC1|nr:hypothetical protein [Beutenbergia cavernae]ACQ81489.1 hypothetical protein Bcav_3245 [Beutenbergia cavernae DSM 12333]